MDILSTKKIVRNVIIFVRLV